MLQLSLERVVVKSGTRPNLIVIGSKALKEDKKESRSERLKDHHTYKVKMKTSDMSGQRDLFIPSWLKSR